jgi:hypothetical protein
MGPAGAELVERLSGALHRQDLALDDEQTLLEGLLTLAAGPGVGDASGPNSGAGPAALHDDAGEVLALDEPGWTQLLSYAFERRYGWSESADGNDDRAMDSLDSRAKKKINETLDKVFPCDSPARLALAV